MSSISDMTKEQFQQPISSSEVKQSKNTPGICRCLREDIRMLIRPCKSTLGRFSTVALNRGLKAVGLYRLSHLFWRLHIPFLPFIFTRMAQFLYGVDIAYQANLGPGIVITHCFGLVIGNEVIIEGRCHLFHGVTLGTRGSEWVGDMVEDGHPHVETDCMFGAGAKVLGPVRIGQNSIIGANAVVTRDVRANSVMVGSPAKRVSERPEMNEQMRPIAGYRRHAR
jgi:serine O-acetyltransferase